MTFDDRAPKVFYPFWMKVMAIVGIPALAAGAAWMVSWPLTETDLTKFQMILCPILGVATLYQCAIGVRCLPYLNTVIRLRGDRIEVSHRGTVSQYRYDELRVESFTYATTTRILTKDGSTVVYFSDGMTNLSYLVSRIGT